MLPVLRRRSTGVDNPVDLFRRDFDTLREDLTRMLGGWPTELGENGGLLGSYPVDIQEEGDKLYVDAELPGFNKDDIEVSVENGVLSISAERKEETNERKKHLHERRFSRVQRQFALPSEVDESSASAKFENGVLHLELTKTQEASARKIAIS